MVGEQLCQLGREESATVEDTCTQLPRPMLEPQCDVSNPSVALQVVETPPRRERSGLSNGLLK